MSPKFATMEIWSLLSGMTRSHTYCELRTGNLRAIKVGKRTLVDVEAGLAWLSTCPRAEIKPLPTQSARARGTKPQTIEQAAA